MFLAIINPKKKRKKLRSFQAYALWKEIKASPDATGPPFCTVQWFSGYVDTRVQLDLVIAATPISLALGIIGYMAAIYNELY